MRHCYMFAHLDKSIRALHSKWHHRRDEGAADETYPFPTCVQEFLAEVHTSKFQTQDGGGHFGSRLTVQRRMAQWVQERLKQDNWNAAMSQDDKTRLSSKAGFGGMAWSNMIAEESRDQWDPRGYRDELRATLGLPSLSFVDSRGLAYDYRTQHLPERCSCGKLATHEHAGRCQHDGSLTLVHNVARDTVVQTLRACHVWVKVEHRFRGGNGQSGFDALAYVRIMDEMFGPPAADTTVVRPLEHGGRPSAPAAAATPPRARGVAGGADGGLAFNTTNAIKPKI